MSESHENHVSRRGLPGWVKVLLGVSVVLMAAGVIMPLVAPAPKPSAVGALATGLAGEAGSGGAAASPWSPAVFALGFSFFVAFAVAYAIRTFVKMALIAAGFMALFLFGLQYSGMIEVKWAAMEKKYDQGSSWISEQTKSFTAFITGALPSAGAAAAGLVAGFRKSK